MFVRHRAKDARAQHDEQPTGLAEDPPADERSALDLALPGQDALTLSTMCACGHVRKDHRGMRIEVRGPCLECDCGEFRPVSETLERLRALLARVERLQETTARLRGQMNVDGPPNNPALPNGTQEHARHLDLANARPFREMNDRTERLVTTRPDQDDHA